MISRPICECSIKSFVFKLDYNGHAARTMLFTLGILEFGQIGSQVDNRDTFPFTHGVLIRLLSLFLPTFLFSLRGGSMYVFMLFLIFQSNIAE